MTSPIQLDLTVNAGLYIYVYVMFSPNGPGIDEALYTVGKYRYDDTPYKKYNYFTVRSK